jgi:hypothetical protein
MSNFTGRLSDEWKKLGEDLREIFPKNKDSSTSNLIVKDIFNRNSMWDNININSHTWDSHDPVQMSRHIGSIFAGFTSLCLYGTAAMYTIPASTVGFLAGMAVDRYKGIEEGETDRAFKWAGLPFTAPYTALRAPFIAAGYALNSAGMVAKAIVPETDAEAEAASEASPAPKQHTQIYDLDWPKM